MKSEVGYLLSFAVGGVLGAGAAWFIAKQKYEAKANEEIEEVRAAYRAKYEPERVEETPVDTEEHKTPSTSSTPSYLAHKGFTKPDLVNYRQKAEEIINNMNYQSKPSEDTDEHIEIIAPDEFGMNTDYEKVTLILTANGYLLDEDMRPVDDEYNLVGMGVNDIRGHFGEYEDDSVHVVNHEKEVYYEILDSLREYREE